MLLDVLLSNKDSWRSIYTQRAIFVGFHAKQNHTLSHNPGLSGSQCGGVNVFKEAKGIRIILMTAMVRICVFI